VFKRLNLDFRQILFSSYVYLIGLVVTCFLFFYSFNLTLRNISIPIIYQGDVISFILLVKRASESWNYLYNINQGYPFGSQLFDYPLTEHLQFILLSIIYKFSTIGFTINIAYLLNYILCTLISIYVLRRFGVNRGIALSIGILFNFSFMHQARLTHYSLSLYFIIPLFFLTYKYIASSSKLVFLNKKKMYLIILVSFTSSFVSSYYSFFHLIVLTTLLLISLITKNSFFSLNSLKCILATVAGLFLAQFPYFLYSSIYGNNKSGALRQFIETDLYSLRLVNLLIPHPDYMIGSIDRIFSEFRSSALGPIGENNFTSLGLMSVVGFILIFYFSLRKFKFSHEVLKILLVTIVPLTLFSTTGGLANLFSYFITPQIRAVNRMSVFILFGGYLALAVCLQHILVKTRKSIAILSLTTIFFLGLIDQMIHPNDFKSGTTSNYPTSFTNSSYFSDQDIGRLINEESKGQPLKVYQLPFNSFPEAPQVNEMDSYYLARPYLFSNSNISFSFPQMKGRPESSFMENLSQLSIKEQLQIVKQLDFNSILIFTGAFNERKIPFEAELYKEIPRNLWKFSSDGSWQFFKFNSTPIAPLERITLKDVYKRTGIYVDDYGVRNANSFKKGWIFSESTIPKWVHELNYKPQSEVWGSWITQDSLTFTIANPLELTCDVYIEGLAFQPSERYKKTKFENARIQDSLVNFTLGKDLNSIKLNKFAITSKEIRISLFSKNRISPKSVGLSSDSRELGIGISKIWLSCQS
jgi:phosphoglycerol transferase